jgi:hypothetical protein
MTYLPTSSLLNYGNALTSYNPTTADLSSLYGLGSPSLSSLGLTGSSSLSALSGLYGSDYSSLYVNRNKDQQIAFLARELAKYKEAAENRTGFLGFPILGANKEGNGGFDTGAGLVSALATYFLPKLFKDGGLSKLFGG